MRVGEAGNGRESGRGQAPPWLPATRPKGAPAVRGTWGSSVCQGKRARPDTHVAVSVKALLWAVGTVQGPGVTCQRLGPLSSGCDPKDKMWE